MLDKAQAKRFVSASTHKKISELLYVLEHVKIPREAAKVKEQLREQVTKLFSFRDIVELHDDQIMELAETIEGIYPERENLSDYVYFILVYLDEQIAKYEKKKEQYAQELIQKHKWKEKYPDQYLNLRYKVWTYTDGYYRQRAQMYGLLRQGLNDLLWFEK